VSKSAKVVLVIGYRHSVRFVLHAVAVKQWSERAHVAFPNRRELRPRPSGGRLNWFREAALSKVMALAIAVRLTQPSAVRPETASCKVQSIENGGRVLLLRWPVNCYADCAAVTAP
jgi:hypothetical protein